MLAGHDGVGDMTVRIGINGFGRIGRNVLRAVRAKDADVEIVAVNDLTDAATNAVLLRYDSTHGRFPGEVLAEDGHLLVDGRKIQVLSESDPAELPWGSSVRPSSSSRRAGSPTARRRPHISKAGAERVVISAPATGADATFVMGVNDEEYDPASTWSCRMRRARRTASSRWSRCSKTPSASRRD